MVCLFLVSFNFLSCYWPKDVIEMFLLWHDEFKRNDNLKKKEAKMKFYMHVIPGYLIINMNLGICNTSHKGGAFTLQKGVKFELNTRQPCGIVSLTKICYCKCLFTSCDKKVNRKPVRNNLIGLKL